MKTYFKRLRHHPGVPIAAMCSVVFTIDGGLFGLLGSLIIWLPVLLTARTQPLPGGGE